MRHTAIRLSVLAWVIAAATPLRAVDCYEEIDPYYWTFDVPSMIHANTVQDAARVRASMVNYLWAGAGYPEGRLPAAVQHLPCDGDPPPPRGPYPNNFPTTFSGLALWLDAADASTVVVSNGKVSKWKDKSGLVNDATQNAASLKPLYDSGGVNGRAAIRFDGLDDYLEVRDDASLDVPHMTLFLVLRVDNPDNETYPVPVAKLPVNQAYLFTLDADNTPIGRVTLSTQFFPSSTKDLEPVSNAAEVWSAVHDGQTLRMFRNQWQSEAAPAAVGNIRVTNGPLRIGEGETWASNTFSGWISEVILYNRGLSDADRRQVEDYLGWKYGIYQAWPNWIRRIGSDNLGCVDRLDIGLDYGLHSSSYLLRPKVSARRLLVFHHGHSDFLLPNGGQQTMKHFLDRGYTVETFWMPLYGENVKTAYGVPGQGTHTFTSHDEMASLLENSQGSFIRFFLEPVTVGLNHAEREFSFDDVNMAGISGGGWTAHMMASLDTRIGMSFPTSGSLPNYLRSGPCPNGSQGDSEQTWSALYDDIATWLDVYVLGGYGPKRRQIQVLNQYDSCCFWGVNYRTYESYASNAVASLGSGKYEVYLDRSHNEHKISDPVIDGVIDPAVSAQVLPYQPETDLVLSQTDSPDPVFRGDPLTYTLNVRNDGPSKARGATLTDTLPPPASLVSAVASQGTCGGLGPVTCDLGTIAEGGTANVTLVVTAATTGHMTNRAEIAYALADFRPASNSSTEATDVGVPGDKDGDGVADGMDCAPSDGSAFAVPAEVGGVGFESDRQTLTWISAAPSAGFGTVHDVLRGALDELPVGGGASETCLAAGIPTASVSDGTIPSEGRGFWYLVRGRNACGRGTYGYRSDGSERSSSACP